MRDCDYLRLDLTVYVLVQLPPSQPLLANPQAPNEIGGAELVEVAYGWKDLAKLVETQS